MSQKLAYFNCLGGASGDMILGALVDLGVDLRKIRQGLKQLDIKGYKLTSTKVKRNGITATKVNVALDRPSRKQHHSRSFKDIKNLIGRSDLPQKVKSNSVEIFHRIGKVEAQIHRTTLNKIHFHEVGAGAGDDCYFQVLASFACDALYEFGGGLGPDPRPSGFDSKDYGI